METNPEPESVALEDGAPAPPNESPVVEPAPAPAPTPRFAFVRAWLEPLAADRVTLFAPLCAAVVLTVSRYHVSTTEYRHLVGGAWAQHGGLFGSLLHKLGLARAAALYDSCTGPIAEYLYWFLGALVLFYALPIGLGRLLGITRHELGAGLGDVRLGLKATGILFLVMLPFVVGASFTHTFNGHYPMAGAAASSGRALVTYELSYASYFIGWEFVYRGLLCVALYPRVGPAAILLHTIPFAVMHAGKPEPEAYGSIVAGVALGVLAVRTRSFWYGALLHAMVAFTMDMLALGQTHRFPKAW